MAIQIDISDTERHLLELLNKVIEGEEVMLSRSGNPIAKLVAIKRKKGKRKAGLFKDILKVAEDIDKPLPENILKEFYK